MGTDAYDQALGHLKAGRTQAAIAGFEAVLAKAPLHPDALHYLGLLRVQGGEHALGVALMNQALAQRPGDAVLRSNHRRCVTRLASERRYELALAMLSALTAAAPGEARLASERARLEILVGRPDAARRTLGRVPDDGSFAYAFHAAVASQTCGDEAAGRRMLALALERKALHDLPSRAAAPSVLTVYATEHLDFGVVVDGGDIAISIAGGHFNAHTFLDPGRVKLSRLFVSGSDDFQAAVGELGRFDVVVNCIADPELYAESLARLSRALAACPRPVLNHPDAVAATSRSAVHRAIEPIAGIRSPATVDLHLPSGPDAAAALLAERCGALPVLLRPPGSSTGIGLHKVDDVQDLAAALDSLGSGPVVAMPFTDFRSRDGLYRKYRVFVIDGEILPEHCVISDHWNVHSSSRLGIMRADAALRAEEERFVSAPWEVLGPAHREALEAVARRLGLDYFGIDFNVRGDTELLVFEANAAMRINPDYLDEFPYLGPPIERIVARCRALVSRLSAGRD